MKRIIAIAPFLLGGAAVIAGLYLLSGGVYITGSLASEQLAADTELGGETVGHLYFINGQQVSATTLLVSLFGSAAALLVLGGSLVCLGL